MDKIAALMIDAVEHPSHAKQRIAALEAEVAHLQRVINHVEWTSPPSPAVCVPFCPWCGRHEVDGHRADCMRQAALEPSP